jgi:hypothetical protein
LFLLSVEKYDLSVQDLSRDLFEKYFDGMEKFTCPKKKRKKEEEE